MQNVNISVQAIAILLLALLAATVGSVHATGDGSSPTYTNNGRISGIDLIHDTVVVEVPVIGNQLMTVGGELVQGATLKKNGQPAELEDFRINEPVTVQWRYTDTGHDILAVIGR